MFNPDDYNDNIGYCEYVFEKNIDLDLNLNTPREVQFVANNYLDEVYARGIADADELYENDKILLEVVDKLEKKFRKFKTTNNVNRVNQEELDEKEKYIKSDMNLSNDKLLSDFEKKSKSNGGHSFSDDYDDFGLDEKIR